MGQNLISNLKGLEHIFANENGKTKWVLIAYTYDLWPIDFEIIFLSLSLWNEHDWTSKIKL